MNSSEVSKSDKGRRGGSRDEIGTDEGNQKLAGKESCTKCAVLGFVRSWKESRYIYRHVCDRK